MTVAASVEAERGAGAESLVVHAGEDGDAFVDVVVKFDVALADMGAHEAADVLDDTSLEGDREGQEERVEFGPAAALADV